jgi:hypothetical protein
MKVLRGILPPSSVVLLTGLFTLMCLAPAYAAADAADPITQVDGPAGDSFSSVPAPAASVSPSFLREVQDFLKHPSVQQDVDPKLFQDFWLKWSLVTVRYKPEGNELRFIYANDIGAEALAKGTYPFPEGAVFAKIGATATHDPIFDNSLVPGTIARIQIMLKKPNDPNARDGWVYSLFISGQTMGHLTTEQIDACQACHLVAQSRDMVFSQPFPTPLGAAPANFDAKADKPNGDAFKASFHPTALAQLPPFVQEALTKAAPELKTVMVHSMAVFQGSLFESQEVLANFAHKDNQAFLMGDEKSGFYLLAIPQKDACVKMLSHDSKAAAGQDANHTSHSAFMRPVCWDQKGNITSGPPTLP